MSHTFFISYIWQVEDRGTQPTGLEAAGTSGATHDDSNLSGLDMENPSLSFLVRHIGETYIDQSTPAGADELQELQLPDANQQQAEDDTARDGVTGLNLAGL